MLSVLVRERRWTKTCSRENKLGDTPVEELKATCKTRQVKQSRPECGSWGVRLAVLPGACGNLQASSIAVRSITAAFAASAASVAAAIPPRRPLRSRVW